jgi:hypothetical protein
MEKFRTLYSVVKDILPKLKSEKKKLYTDRGIAMQYKIRHFPNSEYTYRGPVLTKTRKNGDTYILLTMYTMSHSTSAMNETI